MSPKSNESSFIKGKRGEDFAADYLIKEGFDILHRNWRIGEGEIDLIVKKGSVIAFVEVKTAYSETFGDPMTWVNKAKQRQIGRIAAAWIQRYQPADCTFRFDVIALRVLKKGFELRHLPDAFSL